MADLPEEAIENAYEYIDSVYSSIAYHGKTIGPTAPPANFIPVVFINYIISLKHEAASLGWIKNYGIVNSLDVKLENAKEAIARNNLASAKNLIEAFINEVEAQGCASYDKCVAGKHITPEAYGLLKYNAEYLLKRLFEGVIEKVIEKDLTSEFQTIYGADPGKPAGNVPRIATPSSLIRDIILSRKNGWIDSDGIMTSLLKKAEAIEASIAKGKKKTTENLIKAFINEVNAQTEKHISKEAVKMLTEDANYIMNNL
ncbi:MAG: hypothetical protein WA162_07645 [Thermodesulfobacteriota bacterium]